jgi:AraC-like DNA-binding protein
MNSTRLAEARTARAHVRSWLCNVQRGLRQRQRRVAPWNGPCRKRAGGISGVETNRSQRSCPSRRQVVLRAAAFLNEHITEPVRIADVSRLAGVSERTLRNAFRSEHGVGPKQFDIRQRLHEARRALCDPSVYGTVTTIATRFGFFELGRFARRYKRAFGESPSETIKTHARLHAEAR